MLQNDRHRTRMVPIEFEVNKEFYGLPYKDRVKLVILTRGEINIMLNKTDIVITAPAVLLVSENKRGLEFFSS